MQKKLSERIRNLPPYLFEQIDEAKRKAMSEGRPVIDLGVGDPDLSTPEVVVDGLKEAAGDSANQKYPSNKGLRELREAISAWYSSRFGVELDVDEEVFPLLGSKEGIAHFPLAFVDPGDVVLVPEPGYPPYRSGTILAGGRISVMPLLKDNSFLPDLDSIDEDIARSAKVMFLNYPNNPTGAVAPISFYDKVVKFAKDNDIIVCSDAAYTEISYDGYSPVSFLEAEGAREVGIEFHSLSKTFNMTGWRSAMAVGNSQILKGLAKVKSNIDSGMFQAIQLASVKALERSDEIKLQMNAVYQKRRDAFLEVLRSGGWEIEAPKAAFYIWAPVFDGYDSFSLAKALLEKADIVATPGAGFGPSGEGFVRMALTKDIAILEQASERIKKAFFS